MQSIVLHREKNKIMKLKAEIFPTQQTQDKKLKNDKME
jgi:hypothetical protein